MIFEEPGNRFFFFPGIVILAKNTDNENHFLER